jgi:hypothetical protein
VRQTIKQLAKKGDNKSARILAREVVRSNKQKDRLSVSKARLGSIGSQLSQQLGIVNPLLHPPWTLDFIPHSNGQGLWFAPEVHRDHEIV